MAKTEGEPRRGRSNYRLQLTGIERIHRAGAGIVTFQILAQDGQKEIVLATLPITVDAGPGGLDGVAARACEYMGDALHGMLKTVDELRDHYNKKK
jgi:hypothetical protein